MKKLIVVASLLPALVMGQTALTWQQVKEKFEAANPTLRAAQLNIDESRAQEMTAFLRPNPDISASVDQIAPFSTTPSLSTGASVYRPFAYVFPSYGLSYLIERDHKRELRLESARKSTDVATSTYSTKLARSCSTCETLSCRPCKPRRCNRMRRKTWSTGTANWM